MIRLIRVAGTQACLRELGEKRRGNVRRRKEHGKEWEGKERKGE